MALSGAGATNSGSEGPGSRHGAVEALDAAEPLRAVESRSGRGEGPGARDRGRDPDSESENPGRAEPSRDRGLHDDLGVVTAPPSRRLAHARGSFPWTSAAVVRWGCGRRAGAAAGTNRVPNGHLPGLLPAVYAPVGQAWNLRNEVCSTGRDEFKELLL